MLKPEKLTIGTLARQAGVGVETVRFYERQGLIRQPTAKGSRYRQYLPDDLKRITFIRRTQELGFTLREIQGLLKLNANPRATCADVRTRTEEKMREIEAKILDLRRMKKALNKLVCACDQDTQAIRECRILDCYETGCGC